MHIQHESASAHLLHDNAALDAEVMRLDRQRELGLEVLCLADVKPRPIDWLWPNWIALGKVHVLAGDGGRGKSTILCDIASRTSRGEGWPDGSSNNGAGSVIILAAEDDIEDTLSPRLLAVHADMKRIFNIRSARNPDQSRRTFSLQADLVQLESLIRERGDVRLVIIDPVASYLGKVDSHKNAEVRSVLEPLGDLAARLHVAIVCNNHFSKGCGNANSRIIGSVAFVNQARAAFIVTPDAEDETRLLLMPSKTNIGPMQHGLAYRLEGYAIDVDGQLVPTSRVSWETRPVTMTADQALAAHAALSSGKSPRSEAEDFLRDLLSDGPVSQKDVKEAATGAGLAWATVRRAKDTLGVTAQRESVGAGGAGRWQWSLARCSPDPQDAHVSKVSTLHQGEHLAAPEGQAEPEADEDRRHECWLCGGPGEVLMCDYGEVQPWLHSGCVKAWKADYDEKSNIRMRRNLAHGDS